MIKKYFLYDDNNRVIQFISCLESEIEDYGNNYIETDIEEFVFDASYNYTIENGKIISSEKTDKIYLLNKINIEYENEINKLKVGLTTSEIDTWVKQEAEAKAWLIDKSTETPFIDSMLLSRQDHTKESLVNKILEKAKNYTIEVGKLLGEKQAKEKEITLQ